MFAPSRNPQANRDTLEARRMRTAWLLRQGDRERARRLGVERVHTGPRTSNSPPSRSGSATRPHGPRSPSTSRRGRDWRQESRRRLEFRDEGREPRAKATRCTWRLHALLGGGREGAATASASPTRTRTCCRFFRGSWRVLRRRRTTLHVRLNVYLGNGLSIEEIEDYWLDRAARAIRERACARGHPSINLSRHPAAAGSENKLPYGVGHALSVRTTPGSSSTSTARSRSTAASRSRAGSTGRPRNRERDSLNPSRSA